jgi:trehalose 6-phosphate synthase/phosphatase
MGSMGVWTLFPCIISEFFVHFLSFFFLLANIPPTSHQTLKKDEFYALLSVADLAVITPLRDGMNTTSMEFVIAQEKTGKNPSVLSEFMGISKNMEEALLVNPWNLGVG